MKKQLLSIMLIVGSFTQLNAQCTITPGCSTGTSGYCSTPAANSALPSGTVGSPYSTVIQLSLGSSVSTQVGPVAINGATITNVNGLPSGFTYSANPVNAALTPNSSGCMIISGTASSVYSGTVSASINVSVNLFGQNTNTVVAISWPLDINNGTVTGIQNQIATVEGLFISPNPANNDLYISSTIYYNKLEVIDALGKVVISRENNYSNQTNINVSGLSKGIYFLQATDGNKVITKKFIKE